MKREHLKILFKVISGYSEWFIEFIYILHKNNLKLSEVSYVQNKDAHEIDSKSYPNIFIFIYLGAQYFFRILITLFRN